MTRLHDSATTERFWVKVDRGDADSCWEWIASVDRRGYGQFRLDGRCAKAHRVAYELIKGPIPAGLVIDHLCRNTGCVNPDHLDAPSDSSHEGYFPEWFVLMCNDPSCPGRAVVPVSLLSDHADALDEATR